MLTVPVLLLAAGVVVWPADVAARRLRGLRRDGRGARRRLPRPGTPVIAALSAAVGWLALGPGGAVAATLIGITGWRRYRDRRRLAATLAAVGGLAEALRSLVAELVVGAHPADAADAAAADAEPAAAAALRAAAAAVRLGGEVGDAVGDTAPELADVTGQLGRAWRLAGRHGLPLADVLDAVRADLDQRVRFARQVLARMAGPRASATVLAGLPLLGILLGEASGAAPLRVLSDTVVGQVLLVIGVGLVCAGVVWSARLTGRAVFR
ncbi:type II secretion system F family protein [Actinokineospora sp.]|uniref:type II secretion system F family protein n=1 Tax=Actinokineospora sp. TaxID=1872133 RepID=UPI0040376BF7